MKKLIFILFALLALQVNSQVFYVNMGGGRDVSPRVTTFTIPATGNSLTVTISSFTATDDRKVVGYKLTESSTKPSYSSSGWLTSPYASYTFSSWGTKTLYAWVKDGTGHVSSYKYDQIILTQVDNTAPEVTAFVIPSTATSLTVAISTFTATDNVAVTGYKITESATAPTGSSTGWTSSAPSNYVFSSEGSKTLYGWVKDAANNVSTSLNDGVTITLPDVTKPVITTFAIPATSNSLTISITQFTATDNKAVTGYVLTETNTEPISGWSGTAPTTYTFSTEGTKTLYAWAKDAAGNISLSMSDVVIVSTTPEPPAPEYYTTNYPGTEYYVSATGNDANNGTSELTPWQTITKVNSRTYNAGDAILFKSTDSFYGQITVPSSGNSTYDITFGAYGVNISKPKIYSSVPLTGWNQRGSSNIYTKYYTTTVNQIFISGVRMTEARFPNTGYDFIDTVKTTSSFVANSLTSSVNYTGAKWIGRTEPYKTATNTVTGSSGKTLTLNTAPDGGLTTLTEGFILVGNLALLDAAGEWYYNATTDTLYLWTPNGTDPDNFTVMGSTVNYGVTANSKNHVTIQDLEILNSSINGVYLYACDNFVINNVNILYPDARGIKAIAASDYLTISNDSITGANHFGVELLGTYASITDNVIDSTGLFENFGATGMGEYSYMGSGMYVEGNDNLIQYNRVLNSGYNGIHFEYRNTVDKNFIYNSNITKDDGGAIYTSSLNNYPNSRANNSVITNNIVDGSYGTLSGFTTYGYTLGEGIYLDQWAGYITVTGNTVANIASNAIYSHYGYYHNIRNNTTFRAKHGFFQKYEGIGVNFKHNIVYGFSRDMNDDQTERMVWTYNLTGTALIDSNIYINHYKSTDVFMNQTTSYSFTNWKGVTTYDDNSTIDNTSLSGGTERILYNDTKVAKSYSFAGATAKDIGGNSITSLTLQPFTSKIVTGTNLNLIE